MSMAVVAVVGAGSWGTAASAMLSENAAVRLWARRPELATELRATGRNVAYTGELMISPAVEVIDDLSDAVEDADFVVIAVPSHGLRGVLAQVADILAERTIVVSLTKGLEQRSLLRMTEVIEQVAPKQRRAAFTGPNLVHELIERLPAASVAVSEDVATATAVQSLFGNEFLRVYTNTDVIGAEIAGALKNVIAIGMGMVDGLGFGVNAKSALLTRGLAELTRLGVALGGQASTFAGLAGLGDLVATCTSAHSRNRAFGERLVGGRSVPDIVSSTTTVAEGVRTSSAAVALAAREGVDMPIVKVVAGVIAGELTARDGTRELMRREAGDEVAGVVGRSGTF